MITSNALRKSMLHLGYRSADIHSNYRFAAVDVPDHAVRTVDMAVFLDAPASYKNAALAVVRVQEDEGAAIAAESSRSLGAPYLVVLSPGKASAWTYTSRGPTKLAETPADQWQTLLEQDERFGASAVREVRSIKLRDHPEPQDCLFDPATLYSIQAFTQSALDQLLQSFLSYFDEEAPVGGLSLANDYDVLFPLVFRLLAAKILLDRDDVRIAQTRDAGPLVLLELVDDLYSLQPLRVRWSDTKRKQLASAWQHLREGLFVRNVAADDLAFVYENTLITPDVRKAYGTHSTPPSVADYVIRSFAIPPEVDCQTLTVYEPFAGSCVFLTAALRYFKELLPSQWTPKRTHDHLVSHFNASEIDPFACEIARLALILADYPNHNGWKIQNEDLFEPGRLLERAQASQIVVCNPPFEDFDVAGEDGVSVHKPVAVLDTLLDAAPAFLGIVMPSGLSSHKKYRRVINRALERYADVEILQLPEGVFRHAAVGAEVLVAQQRRDSVNPSNRAMIRNSVVSRTDWPHFTQSLRPSSSTEVEVDLRVAPGLTGLQPLRDVWEELRRCPRLGSVAHLHRGLEWSVDQAQASRDRPAPGFREGLHRIGGSITQFKILQTVYLDCRPSKLRGGAIKHPWDEPKVLCNAVRTSRGPWRIAAAVDLDGLHASQQFLGIWLKELADSTTPFSLLDLASILNSPISNAFSYVHDGHKGFRIETMEQIPLPCAPLAKDLGELVKIYCEQAISEGPLFAQESRAPTELLMEIDAAVLAAYDLPPKLERELLRYMSGGGRPCPYDFPEYPGTQADSGALPLSTRLAMRNREQRKSWQLLSTPLPPEAAHALDDL